MNDNTGKRDQGEGAGTIVLVWTTKTAQKIFIDLTTCKKIKACVCAYGKGFIIAFLDMHIARCVGNYSEQ